MYEKVAGAVTAPIHLSKFQQVTTDWESLQAPLTGLAPTAVGGPTLLHKASSFRRKSNAICLKTS